MWLVVWSVCVAWVWVTVADEALRRRDVRWRRALWLSGGLGLALGLLGWWG